MNREEILSLNDEEIREEIAKRFGWKHVDSIPNHPYREGGYWIYESGEAKLRGRKTTLGYEFLPSPNWTTDISSAYALVRDMNDFQWVVNVESDNKGCSVYVTQIGVLNPIKICEIGKTECIAMFGMMSWIKGEEIWMKKI